MIIVDNFDDIIYWKSINKYLYKWILRMNNSKLYIFVYQIKFYFCI